MTKIRRLEWDSKFFGVEIGMVRSHCLNASTASELIEEARQRRLRCLYFLGSPDPGTLAAAQSTSFRLVDVRIVLKTNVRDTVTRGVFLPLPRFVDLRIASAQDIPALRRMAVSVHHDSRFIADPKFPRSAGRRLFSEWIARSVAGLYDDQVWIAAKGRDVAGYLSIRKKGRIGLMGISRRWRRQGLGGNLLRKACEKFVEDGILECEVVTQGGNRSALGFYQRLGFRVTDTQLWYHRWL